MTRVLNRIAGSGKAVAKQVVITLLGEKRSRQLFYDLKNVREFTDLSYHERMVYDSSRVDAYFKGIGASIQPGDVVVDVGAGTGILSFFAARRQPKKIYAIDHSSFISVAELVADSIGVDNIEFVRANSKDFTPTDKVDVILHEQIGQCLFGENMVEHLLDLKKRILKPSGRIVPARFELYIEPVALKEEYRVPFLYEQNVHGIDFACTRGCESADRFRGRDYLYRSIRNFEVDQFLTRPEPILYFDLNEIESEEDIPRSFLATREVTRTGEIDGYCVYFRTIFNDEISFDNSPLHRQTNWWNLLIRSERKKVNAGDSLSYAVSMGRIDDTKSWSVEAA